MSGAFAVAPLMLLAGCGSSGAASSNEPLTPVQATSYAELPPATTTTTTTTLPGAVPEAGSTSPTEQIHTIVAGDTLSGIAAKYGVTMDVIINYNGWTDGTDHVLLPGQSFNIPPNALVPGQASDVEVIVDSGDTGVTADSVATGAGCTYVVVVNDNPSKVANKFDITFDELQNANVGINMLESFPVGYQLTIPPNGSC